MNPKNIVLNTDTGEEFYLDPNTGEEISITEAKKREGEQAAQRALAAMGEASGMSQGKRILDAATGKVKIQTPKEAGNLVKDIATLPLTLMTAPIAAPIAGLVAYSPVGKAMQEGMSSLDPETAEAIGITAELVGTALPMLPKLGAVAKGLTPLKKAVGKFEGYAGVKDPTLLQRADVSKFTGEFKEALGKTPGEVGKGLKQDVMSMLDDAWKPAKALETKIIAQKNFPIRMGINTADKIKQFVAGEYKKGNIFNTQVNNLENVVKYIEEVGNRPEALLNARRTLDASFTDDVWKGASKISTIKKGIRNIINNEIEKYGLQDPKDIINWRKANQDFAKKMDVAETMGKGEGKNITEQFTSSDENYFKSDILNAGSENIKKMIDGGFDADKIRKGGMEFIASNSVKDGVFNTNKFKSVIQQIGEDKGRAIFGNNWGQVKQVKSIVDFANVVPKIMQLIPLVNRTGFSALPQKGVDLLLNSQLQNSKTMMTAIPRLSGIGYQSQLGAIKGLQPINTRENR